MFYATGLAPSWSPKDNGKKQTAKMCRMLVSRIRLVNGNVSDSP